MKADFYDTLGESFIRAAQNKFETQYGYWLDIESERKCDKTRMSSFDWLYYSHYCDEGDEVFFIYNEHTPHDCPYHVILKFNKSELE